MLPSFALRIPIFFFSWTFDGCNQKPNRKEFTVVTVLFFLSNSCSSNTGFEQRTRHFFYWMPLKHRKSVRIGSCFWLSNVLLYNINWIFHATIKRNRCYSIMMSRCAFGSERGRDIEKNENRIMFNDFTASILLSNIFFLHILMLNKTSTHTHTHTYTRIPIHRHQIGAHWKSSS